VGRLVLYACGEAGEENFRSPTLPAPRCNWPTSGRMCAWTWPRAASIFRRKTCERFGVSDETIAAGIATPEFRALMRLKSIMRALFEQGLPLIGMVNRDLALDLDLFSRGGLEILRAIERSDYDVLSARPAISKRTKLGAGAARRQRQAASISPPWQRQFERRRLDSGIHIGRNCALQAYAECRSIARREAKNFYYAFVALPTPPQRHLRHLCLHAQGRRPGRRREPLDCEERRAALDAWLAQWRGVCHGGRPPIRSFSPCAMPLRASTFR
jgi:phytoene/squalene synthetase